MRRLLSLKVLLPTITALMALGLIVGCTFWAAAAQRQLSEANQVAYVTSVSADISTAMRQLRLERTGVTVALARRGPPPAADWAAAAVWRKDSARAIDSAFSKLKSPPSSVAARSFDGHIADIRAKQAIATRLRDEAYVALRNPRAPRRQGLRHDWIEAQTNLIDALHSLTHRVTLETAGSDPYIVSLFLARHEVSAVIEAAGNDLLLVGERVVDGRRLTPDELLELARQQGRVEAAWAPLAEQTTRPDIPLPLRRAVAEARSQYFNTAWPVRMRIVEALAEGRPSPIGPDELGSLSNANVAVFTHITRTSTRLMTAHAQATAAHARAEAEIAIALAALSAVLGVVATLFVTRGVVAPMRRISQAMQCVADGDLDSAIPYQARPDELGDLARSLGVFRQGALEKRSMEQALIDSRVAQKTAEAANEMKSQFVANVSHEIRTPMNGVLGLLYVLSRKPLEPEIQALVAEAIRSGKLLQQLLDDVIDLSKIEEGRLALNPQPVAPAQLLAGVVNLLRPQAEAKGVTLDLVVEGDPGWVEIDELRLGQVLLNLVGNAVKFTLQGRVTARLIASGPDAAGRQQLRFEVADTGVGIPQAAQTALFSRFTQADGATSRKFGGSGLGLSISRSLVALMGGEIGFNSREGQGSTFWVQIDAPIAAAPDGEAEVGLGDLSGVRILVVEDNATNQLVAKLILEELGAVVETADDGALGLAAVKRQPFDLVLMDVQMPNMDGVEATQRIRSLGGAAARTPIIGLTANVMERERQTYLMAGMQAVIGKPLDVADLLGAIGRVLQHAPPTTVAA